LIHLPIRPAFITPAPSHGLLDLVSARSPIHVTTYHAPPGFSTSPGAARVGKSDEPAGVAQHWHPLLRCEKLGGMENTDLFVCVDHIGYAVPNLDEAIDFHTRVLGFRVLHRETNAEQGVEEAMLGTGDQLPQSAQIQLLSPLSPDSTIGKFIENNRGRGGIQQVCYRVGDLDHVTTVLRSRGVRLLYDEPKTGTGGSRIQFAHPKDTGGILLELVEPAPDSD
jgi:methylmalonyl-CoA/ethylmalonyl-CoA epimerase